MRSHAVLPPASDGTIADLGKKVGSKFYKQGDDAPEFGVTRRKDVGGLRYIRVVPEMKGGLTLEFPPAGEQADNTYLPIYWLPWYSLSIMGTQIPAIPPNADPNDYPKIFFTTQLSGCSIFAYGDPASPKIAHAGVDGVRLPRDAKGFWEDQMLKTRSGFSSKAIKGSIDANMYADRSAPAKALAQKYTDFLNNNSKNEFKMDLLSVQGCAFGIRTGRRWTLYLQKIGLMQKVTFLKKSEVVATPHPNPKIGGMRYNLAAGGAPVAMQSTPAAVKKIGGLTLPSIMQDKPTKIFSTTSTFSLPTEVVEFYPNSRSVGEYGDIARVG
jgi:hypothetical protein